MDEKRTEKVVKGNVEVRKKTPVDGLADAAMDILKNRFIPVAKQNIADALTSFVRTAITGSDDRPNSRRNTWDNYDYGRRYRDDSPRSWRDNQASDYSYNDISFDTRADAEEVLDALDGILARYKVIRVADLYDAVGATGSYTDNRYGWMSTRHFNITRRGNRYYLDLPKAQPLD